MKKLKTFAFASTLCAIIVAFVGCSSIPPAPLVEEDATTARVYFLMPRSAVTVSFTGWGPTVQFGAVFSLWDGGTFLSTITDRSSIMVNLKEGTHYLMVAGRNGGNTASGENWYIMRAELAAGRSYYFTLAIVPGLNQPNLIMRNVGLYDEDISEYMEAAPPKAPMGSTDNSGIKMAQWMLEKALNGSEEIDMEVPASMGVDESVVTRTML